MRSYREEFIAATSNDQIFAVPTLPSGIASLCDLRKASIWAWLRPIATHGPFVIATNVGCSPSSDFRPRHSSDSSDTSERHPVQFSYQRYTGAQLNDRLALALRCLAPKSGLIDRRE